MEENRVYRKNYISQVISSLGIELTDRMTEQFLIYYEFLTEKNQVMNLTAITDFEEVVVRHFADSLSIVKGLKEKNLSLSEKPLSMIDLGSGAGFPGVPIKIAFPQTQMVLADSLQKRVRFLDELIEKCRLENITAVHGRAEELARKEEYREQFDFCVSRAVANLSSLSEYCLPFVKPGGWFISYKTGNAMEEIRQAGKAVKTLGGEPDTDPVSFTLPPDLSRVLVMIRKTKPTPARFPRKPGTPAKDPL